MARAIHSLAINKDKDILYIGSGSSLIKMDLATEAIMQEVSLSNAVAGMAIDDNLGYLALIMQGKDELFIYHTDTLEPVRQIKTEKMPSDVSVNPSTDIAVLTNKLENSITIISLEQNAVVDTLSLFEQPDAIAIDPANNHALIAHKDGISIVKLENPVPHIDFLIPNSARIGDSGFTLSIEGAMFVKDSQTQFNKKNVPTYFLTNEKLHADIPSGELMLLGDVPVTVANPLPGGGVSNTFAFNLYDPVAMLESISPDTVIVKTAFSLRVSGRNFFNGAAVSLNGKNLKTRFISSILLEAEVDAPDVQTPGKYVVSVVNPLSDASTLNPLYLNVVDEGGGTQPSAAGSSESQKQSKTQTGALKGRVINTNKEPVEGVTVKIKNILALTNAEGYFMLENVPSGKQHLMLHGSTAKDTDARYPTIPLTVDIEAGKTTEMPFQIYLHKQKKYNFKEINPHEDTILTDPDVPGFEMRIPKGVNIIGWDGKPNQRVSVRTVPTDRLPVKPLPQNAFVRTVYMFYFDKVGGGIPDQPIPIKAPNDLGLLPGEKAVLWYYDESPNEGEAPNDWVIAGTGTITPDGKYIVSDPGVGIPKFCCGATAWGGTGASIEKTGPEGSCGQAGDPVDLATGYFIHEKTDLHIPGIIPVNITRYYRSKDAAGNENVGAFGRNTYFEYDWWMGTYTDMLLLIKPGNYQYRFPKQADGTYINTTDPAMAGAVATVNIDGTKTLRMRDGWTYKFDSSGDLIEIADRNGNNLTFERETDFLGGYLMKITASDGKTITFNQTRTGFQGMSRTDSITDNSGRTIGYTYDTYNGFPRLTKVTYPDLSTIEYQYDSSGRMSGIINEKGILEVVNEYDANNRVIKQTHADGGTHIFNYTIAGGNITETSMTAPNGGVTTWRFYDDTGAFRDKYITQNTMPDGITKYEKEPGTNLLLSVTDLLGRKITYTYYSNGLTKTVTDNIGNVTRYEYESLYGLPTKITDANQKDTIFTYTYDANNKITRIEIQNPLLEKTTINFNTNGMPTSITDPNQNTTTYLYENTDKPAELTKIIDMLNNLYSFSYDELGRLKSTTDANGNTTSYTYDFRDRITEALDPMGFVTRYAYDEIGNLLSVIDAKGQTIRYEYDERNRLKKMIDQLRRTEAYTYNTSDNLIELTDRKGQTSTYIYDLMNRITKATYADSSYTDYTYDPAGHLTGINDSISGAISYTYSNTGCAAGCGSIIDKITKEITPLGTIDYTYDAVGRRTSMTVAGQPTVNYSYYDNGLPKDIRQMINGIERKFNFGYDAGGRRRELKYFQGTATTPTMETTYAYDTANRLLNMQHLQSTTVLENLLYEYDANGNRTRFTRDASQPLGNEDTNILCGAEAYTWDSRNRLVGFSGFDALCASLSVSFKYDALGRRIEKIINGVTTQYIYDGWDIIQEIQGGAATNYIRTLTIDEPLARTKADGIIRHYKTEALGSVIGLVDDDGTAKTVYAYDPFGNVTISGEASDNPFQFAGRENDGTGLLYERNRYYSFELQRYISEDPIRLAGGDVNFYVRVGNSPVNFIDPSGLFIGSLLGKITGKTAEELALGGKIAGAIAGTAINLGGAGGALINAAGGVQTVGLGLAIGTAGTGVGVGILGGVLVGLGGYEIGNAFNNLYEDISGQPLGADIYDWLHPPKKCQ